jgi:hypothetical protein
MKKYEHMLQDKTPKNELGQRHGHWVWLRTDGSLMLIADYVNDVPFGYMEYHKKFSYEGSEPIDYEYYAR